MSQNIPLMRPHFESEEIDGILEVLKSGWVSQGLKSKEFETMASKYLGIEHSISVTNCTSALHLALLALDIGSGDEVMVADYTYPATSHSVLYCGAKPVFVDIKPDTYNIDPSAILKKITSRTKAIIPVHTFGQTADMDELLNIASQHDLKVVEDAACAFGARYKDKHAGTIGDIGCFSFHARKGLTTGEGGMIVTNNETLARKMRKLSVFGITAAWEREETDEFFVPEFTEVGYNYKMSDITAAVGVAQLNRLDKHVQRKQELASYWDEKLDKIESIQSPITLPHNHHVYQSYVALLDRGINRNKVIQKLRKNGVQAQIGTYASHIQPVYKSQDKCPSSLDVFQRALALPFYYDLKEEEIDYSVEKLKTAIMEIR